MMDEWQNRREHLKTALIPKVCRSCSSDVIMDPDQITAPLRRYRVIRRVSIPRTVMSSLLPSRVFIVTSLFPSWSTTYGLLSSTVCIRADLLKSDTNGRHYYSCVEIVPFPQKQTGLIKDMRETITTWKRLLTAWIYQERISNKEAEMSTMLSILQEEKETLLVCLERERMKNEEVLVNLSTLEKVKDELLRRESALETAGKVYIHHRFLVVTLSSYLTSLGNR